MYPIRLLAWVNEWLHADGFWLHADGCLLGYRKAAWALNKEK